MLNKITVFIERHQLLRHDGGKYIVALSGGADSVALLLVMKQLGYDVEAAHCNFHLRGEESDRDEQFVCDLCKSNEIPLHLIHFDTNTYAELHQVSIEMAARELRYRYFEQLRQDIGAEDVCVAHHEDDAVETLLMNLIRGTGIHGLTGIRPRNGHVVRPLLGVSRSEIVGFLDELHQPYVTDSTNLVPDVVRNKIRLEVIPLLQTINPAVKENIIRTAKLMAEVEQVYDEAVGSAIDAIFGDGAVNINRLMQQPSPESLLYELLAPRGFSSPQVEQVFSALSGPPGRLFQSATHEVVVDRGRLVVEERRSPLPELCIPEPGIYRYHNDRRFRIAVTDGVSVSREHFCATLDAAKVVFPLTIRPVKSGDRFQPFGMKGTRLVSDYLTDLKLTILEKRRQLVVCDASGCIVWLVGHRTDQRAAVSTTTRNMLVIEHLCES